MSETLINLRGVCKITGYRPGAIYALLGAGVFPSMIRRGSEKLFILSEVTAWDCENRKRLISEYDVVRLLHTSYEVFESLCNYEDFPAPVYKHPSSCFKDMWNVGEVLDWRAKHWRSY